MAASPERKTAIKLSQLMGSLDSFPIEGFSRSPTSKSPRSFDDRAVGLGIVAAMSDPGETPVAKVPRLAVPARSLPIPIISARPITGYGGTRNDDEEEEEMELSESYTCVISHVGGKSVRKRIYFDDGVSDGIISSWGNSGEFSVSLPPADHLFPAADFLNRCHMCRKKLHGLDIFMYRGENAFCSVECRTQQIESDDKRGNFGSSSLMKKPFDCSLSPSPCPAAAPLNFAAGIAAAS